ncbi:MAG: deaminase [Thermoleophilia bacterium]
MADDYLSFSAAHFLTYDGDCELLHGHTYRIRVSVVSPSLDANHYVIGYRALRDVILSVILVLRGKLLIPATSDVLMIHSLPPNVFVRFGERNYSFPMEDACLLPIPNITSEMLAKYLSFQTLLELPESMRKSIECLTLEVEESRGHSASFRVDPSSLGELEAEFDMCDLGQVDVPPTLKPQDVGAMQALMDLAEEGLGAGDSVFASIVFREGQVVGKGRNRTVIAGNPIRHAEVVAIDSACEQNGADACIGSTLFTSCEPCLMCLSAAYYAGCSRIVYAATLDDARRLNSGDPPIPVAAVGRQLALPIKIEGPVERARALGLFEEFMKRYGRI